MSTAVDHRHPMRTFKTSPFGVKIIKNLQLRISSTCRSTSNTPEPSTSGNESGEVYNYTYLGSDGRMKATFEQAFKGGVAAPDTYGQAAPWDLGYQMSERDLMMNDDLKLRLVGRIIAEQLNLTDTEVFERIQSLQSLLPDLKTKLASMKPSIVSQMVSEVDHLPMRLLTLKSVFPAADVSKLAMREPALVLGFDGDHLASIAEQLRETLPGLNIDKLVEEFPMMLDVEELRVAMAEASRIMPSLDIVKTMGSDPSIILSFQRGAQLIPYDPPHPVNESGGGEEEKDDDEYAAYYH